MGYDIRVYAPSVEGAEILEATGAIARDLNASVAVSGYFGTGPKPAVWINMSRVIAGVDLSRYWAIFNVYLNTPVGNAVVGALVSKVLDALVGWIRSGRRPSGMVKVRLYGPDGNLLREEDLE